MLQQLAVCLPTKSPDCRPSLRQSLYIYSLIKCLLTGIIVVSIPQVPVQFSRDCQYTYYLLVPVKVPVWRSFRIPGTKLHIVQGARSQLKHDSFKSCFLEIFEMPLMDKGIPNQQKWNARQLNQHSFFVFAATCGILTYFESRL